jgi:hypothetical protein
MIRRQLLPQLSDKFTPVDKSLGPQGKVMKDEQLDCQLWTSSLEFSELRESLEVLLA